MHKTEYVKYIYLNSRLNILTSSYHLKIITQLKYADINSNFRI